MRGTDVTQSWPPPGPGNPAPPGGPRPAPVRWPAGRELPVTVTAAVAPSQARLRLAIGP
jgi:hypothetical protein